MGGFDSGRTHHWRAVRVRALFYSMGCEGLGMSLPSLLLVTKFALPRRQSSYVKRPRLHARLAEGVARPLTLLSAPPGFGKSSLLGAWLAEQEAAPSPRSAWLTLDDHDNDPLRFWMAVIAALQRVESSLGAPALALFFDANPPPVETILTSLINELATRTEPLLLVLDDYHVIEQPAIHRTLAFLIEHAPSQLHLVISSRADPPLPLARWRARGLLAELRTDDLRFTPEEALAFFHRAMRLPLSTTEVAKLSDRTEGWIAGMQLAALSMQGAANIQTFIRGFSGSNRYIIDYLVEEVLNRQPEPLRVFLLQTAILDRLCGGLCDAVVLPTAPAGSSQALLEQLEQANLFLIPLDEERRWYRYHHLFAEALRNRLRQSPRAEWGELHRRASKWYEANGLTPEAIHHALASDDIDRVATLVEQVGLAGFAQPVIQQQLSTWLARLPQATIQARPRLCLIQAWRHFNQLQIAAALQAVDWAEAQCASDHSASDGQCKGEIAAMRALITALHPAANPAQVIDEGNRALSLLHTTQPAFRSIAAGAVAAAYIRQEQLCLAEPALAEAIRMGRAATNLHLTIVAWTNLAMVQRVRGALRHSRTTCQAALEWLRSLDAEAIPGAGSLHTILAGLHREWNDLTTGERHAECAVRHGEAGAIPLLMVVSRLALMDVQRARGQIALARQTWAEAVALIDQHGLPLFRDATAAMSAQLSLAEGDLDAARAWVQANAQQGATMAPVYNIFELVYQYEVVRVARAQILLAQAQARGNRAAFDDLVAYIRHLRTEAQSANSCLLAIKIDLLEARARHAVGHAEEAATRLRLALTRAAPEGYLGVFLDEGEPLRRLLTELQPHLADAHAQAHAGVVLAAFGAAASPDNHHSPAPMPSPLPHLAPAESLIEPLSPRELEVLHLMAAGLSNQEIADELIVALSTVKKHINNIFGKLGAAHRTQALVLARQHNLLPR
ncbi:MAG: hypothetical protein KJZ93_09530 [Caldilineaceae bacterium]|nr:hypothetical protein [Caldilineaceae bacterium]